MLLGNLEEIIKWVEKFFINDVLVLLMNEFCDIKVCWLCKRGNEEEEVIEFCLICKEFLCKMCLKCYRKSLISMNYKMCLFFEIGFCSFDFGYIRNIVSCEKYNGK